MAKLKDQVRICAFCKEPFVPVSGGQQYCKRPHYMNCPVCGKQYLVTNNENLKRPPVACSYACRVKRTQQTSLQKYGMLAPGNNPEARNKAKATMIERYGAEYTLQSDELKEKCKNTVKSKYGVDNPAQSEIVKKRTELTNLERYGSTTYLTSEAGKQQYAQIMMNKYGVVHPLQSEAIQEKWKQTTLDKYGSECVLSSEYGIRKTQEAAMNQYGVDHFSKAPAIQKKIANTCLERYGVTNASKSKEIIERIKETTMKHYGVPFYVLSPEVQRHYSNISKLNKAVANQLSEKGVISEFEYIINKYRYDLYVPSHNMLVEINPSYTHNAIGNHWTHEGLSQEYHINKCKKAIEKGFNVCCVFDWDNVDDLIDRLTQPHLPVDSESLTVYKLTRQAYRTFLDRYGHRRIKKYNRKEIAFGLVKDNVLYQVILLQKSIYHHHRIMIADYGKRYGYKINGGLNKLLSFIFETYNKDDIMLELPFDRLSLEDIDEMKLHYLHSVSPLLIWSKNKEFIINSKKVDKDDLVADGWLPVYDCGQAVYTF